MHRASRPVATVLLAAACGGTTTAPPPAGATLALVAGDGQHGLPGAPLPRPLVVQLRSEAGEPIPDARVDFSVVAGGGEVLNRSGITDRDGFTAVVWLLGQATTPQRLRMTAAEVEPVIASASGTPAACIPAACPGEPLERAEPFHLVTFPTYDGSGQGVHPDLQARATSAGLPHLMAFTPYPFGNATFENPSLLESANARHWRTPGGVAAPLVTPSGGHLSDPDLVHDPEGGRYHLYYRHVSGGRNLIRVLTSSDAIAWTGGDVVLDVASHRAVSPAVVVPTPASGRPWQLWSVNAGAAGCSASTTVVERRISADGLQWGAPEITDLALPGQVIWHLDVQWIPARGEYWALYNSYAVGGSCVTRALFLARSADGMHWTQSGVPLLVAGRVPAFADVVYRATFRVSPDGAWLELLPSGAFHDEGRYHWSIGRMVIAARDALDGNLAVGTEDTDWRRPAPASLPPPEPFDLP